MTMRSADEAVASGPWCVKTALASLRCVLYEVGCSSSVSSLLTRERVLHQSLGTAVLRCCLGLSGLPGGFFTRLPIQLYSGGAYALGDGNFVCQEWLMLIPRIGSTASRLMVQALAGPTLTSQGGEDEACELREMVCDADTGGRLREAGFLVAKRTHIDISVSTMHLVYKELVSVTNAMNADGAVICLILHMAVLQLVLHCAACHGMTVIPEVDSATPDMGGGGIAMPDPTASASEAAITWCFLGGPRTKVPEVSQDKQLQHTFAKNHWVATLEDACKQGVNGRVLPIIVEKASDISHRDVLVAAMVLKFPGQNWVLSRRDLVGGALRPVLSETWGIGLTGGPGREKPCPLRGSP